MSKTPISASSDAAGTSPIPWSCAAGIRCVPIRPVVDAPQMKKLPVRSQKVFECRAVEQALDGAAERVAAGRRRIGDVGAVREEPEVGRPVAHQERHERQDDPERDGRDGDGGVAPAVALHDPGERGEEDQLAGGVRGGEDAGDEPAPPHEPPVRDQRGERHRDRARRDPVDDAPEQHELPRGAHEHRQARADRHREQRADHHPLQPVALRERRRERAAEPEEHQVDEDREPEQRAAPAELVLQRHDQHTARRAEAGRRDQRDETDRGDDPGVVHPLHAGVNVSARPVLFP